jgi:AraC-like DNA-binding protein
VYSVKEAARRAGISEELLQLWVSTKRIQPAVNTPAVQLPVPDRPGEVREDFAVPAFYAFDERNIEQIRALAEKPTSKRGNPVTLPAAKDFYTVGEVAALMNLSPDTIRRLFADEAGVIPLGEDHPRGKRKNASHCESPRKWWSE